MKISLVARDMAPSQILERVEAELMLRGGHRLVSYLGKGKPLGISDDQLADAVGGSDFVLIGMSSSAALVEPELLAAKVAAARGVPFGFVCDIFDCHRRPWFEPYRNSASFIFTFNEEEAADARTFFPRATVVNSGNPCWEEYFDPTMPKEEVCKLLGGAFSKNPDRKIILCVGGKDIIGTSLFYGDAIIAAHAIDAGLLHHGVCRVVVALHPGDPNPPEFYADLAKFSDVPVRIVKAGEIKTPDLIGACDVLVTLASNTGVAAACKRKPVIHYFTPLYWNKIKQSTPTWKPLELRIAWQATDGQSLVSELQDVLLGDDACRDMLERQMVVFPELPSKGTAARKICDTLESVRVRE